MMKKLIALISAISLLLSFSTVAAFAAPEAPLDNTPSISRTEEVTWKYRTLEDGRRQKRLWSITYSRWLTDWIDC